MQINAYWTSILLAHTYTNKKDTLNKQILNSKKKNSQIARSLHYGYKKVASEPIKNVC